MPLCFSLGLLIHSFDQLAFLCLCTRSMFGVLFTDKFVRGSKLHLCSGFGEYGLEDLKEFQEVMGSSLAFSLTSV